ncbi:MAG: hypothetical protein IKX81_00275 [Firmicutes bacterium]|nr:hypothetical protein [Bacillota bacterium]
MWIRIDAVDGPHFTIPVPLFMAGSPLVLKLVSRYGGSELEQYVPVAKAMVGELRKYIRRNGHFTLVRVEDSDGDLVEITV